MAEAFRISDVEILLSTMNRNSLDFLEPMFPFAHFSEFNILIVNQTTERNQLKSEYPTVRVINSFEKGLSKSRNLAIENATGRICLITDDDVVFSNNFTQTIADAFNDVPDAALIAFSVLNSQGVLYRDYPKKRLTQAGPLPSLMILSIEMAVNRELVGAIRFDNRFGLGSEFTMGEEAIFVNSLKGAGHKVVREPKVIVSHPQADSHGKVTIREKYYIQGALFTRLFGFKWICWIFLKLVFEIKNKQIQFNKIPTALRASLMGRRAFLKQ